MATNHVLSYFLIFLSLVGYLCYSASAYDFNENHNLATADFCVAQQSAPADKLQGFIDYVCGAYGCGAITPLGPCYLPDNLVAHASFVLDLLYKITGTCNLDIGYITNIDPSYDLCHYP